MEHVTLEWLKEKNAADRLPPVAVSGTTRSPPSAGIKSPNVAVDAGSTSPEALQDAHREGNIGPFSNINIFDIEPLNIGIPVLNIALLFNGIGFPAIVA